MDFGERAAHDHVLGGGDELDPGLVVVAPDIFGVSGVEDEQHVRRQAAVQALDLIERHVGAGRVVRIGKEHDLGALAHRGKHRIDVGGVVSLRRRDRRRARAERGDGIDEKAVGGMDRFIAVAEIGVGDEIQEIVRAGAADDSLGVKPEGAADRFAQRGRRTVGIVLQVLADRAIGGDRMRARARAEFRSTTA